MIKKSITYTLDQEAISAILDRDVTDHDFAEIMTIVSRDVRDTIHNTLRGEEVREILAEPHSTFRLTA